MELWLDIPNYDGYQVSNFGRVRTHNKLSNNSLHSKRVWKDRILKYKGKTPRTGYRVDLWKGGKPKTFLVARLVAFTFYGKDINNHRLTVNHIDGNRFNNKLDNLELVSLKENVRHGFRTGLYSSSKKVKLVNKITGTIIYPSSLSEGSKIINKNAGYLSNKIGKNIFEDNEYKWEILP